jgi:predicted phage-related endonuclease
MHPNVKALIEREYAAQKSEEWLALRGNMLTASDAATAIGKNKYETPEGLLLKNAVSVKSLLEMQPHAMVKSTKTKLVSYMKRGMAK